MADLAYNGGLDLLAAWETGSYLFLLVNGYSPNRDHRFITDLVPATNEISATGYTRVTATGTVRTVNDVTDRITYDADDPDFGVFTATVTGMVLAHDTGSDATAELIGFYDVTATPTGAGTFTVELSTLGVAYLDSP